MRRSGSIRNPALVSRGNVFSTKGDVERAIAGYNAAIGLNPKFSFCFVRGRSYLFADSVEKALADFSQAALSGRGSEKLSLEPCHQFDMRGVAELVDRRYAFDGIDRKSVV